MHTQKILMHASPMYYVDRYPMQSCHDHKKVPITRNNGKASHPLYSHIALGDFFNNRRSGIYKVEFPSQELGRSFVSLSGFHCLWVFQFFIEYSTNSAQLHWAFHGFITASLNNSQASVHLPLHG